jgi:hypothetical protein
VACVRALVDVEVGAVDCNEAVRSVIGKGDGNSSPFILRLLVASMADMQSACSEQYQLYLSWPFF